MTRYACLLLLAGCSGSAFSVAEHPLDLPEASAPDAGSDGGAPDPRAGDDAEASLPDAEWEASVEAGHDAAPEAADAASEAAEHDAAPEAPESDGFVCTSFASTGQPGTGCFGTYAIPSYFAIVYVSNQSCQTRIATPAECQCSQTYSCACLQTAGVCAGGWISCQDAEEITVTCQ